MGESVSVVPLDTLGLSRLALVKVDVEGMEAEALLGAERTIAQHRPILYVENDRRDRSERPIALIGALIYDLWWHLPPMFNPDNFRGRGRGHLSRRHLDQSALRAEGARDAVPGSSSDHGSSGLVGIGAPFVTAKR